MKEKNYRRFGDSMKARPVTSLAMIVLPTIILAVVHITVTPLKEMFVIEPLLMYAWYIVGAIIGIIMWRKMRIIKDHEFRRAVVMKGMKEVFAAEEAGVWSQNASLDSEISAEGEARLKGQVSAIDGEGPEMELDLDHKVNVDLLMESKHIQKASKRVTGKGSLDSEELESTIGAIRKTGSMDRLLDFLGGLFSGKDARQSRSEYRNAQLLAAARANPVVAQRPVAPIQQKKDTEKEEIKMTTMSDDGGHETYVDTEGIVSSQSGNLSETEKVYAWDKELSNNQSNADSIESMAMIGGYPTTTTPQTSVTGVKCGSCGVAVTGAERFCEGCGSSL
ncbi:MAG: hypothetical protein O3B00_03500 [archaeon]|nr:hypothetical protein [archaeon]MDA1130547.1 hypothetical protein [archaeon]